MNVLPWLPIFGGVVITWAPKKRARVVVMGLLLLD